jgi:hypothetical protein
MRAPEPLERCGAHTRSGGVCGSRPMRNGGARCRMHGGASRRGRQHPRYSHGLYSKYSAAGRERREGIERRKRERAQSQEWRYIERRLYRWLARQGEHYDVLKAFKLMDGWRREYRAGAGLPEPREPAPLSSAQRARLRRAKRAEERRQVEAIISAAVRDGLGLPPGLPVNPAVEGLRAATARAGGVALR